MYSLPAGSDADSGSDDVVERFAAQRAIGLAAVVFAAISLLAVAVLTVGILGTHAVLIFLSVVVLATFPIASWMLVRLAVLRPTLRTTRLDTPRPLRGWRTVALSDIAGVGLRYVSNGRATGWRLLVWRREGPAIGITVAQPGHSAPAGHRPRLRPLTGHVPHLDWDYLAASPAGKAALTISEQVTRVQGPGGPLATAARQVSSPRGFDTAYWSPDGRTGVFAAIP